jgi:hypothetical protein
MGRQRYFPGNRFGRLKLVRLAEITSSRRYLWVVMCDCGAEVTVGIDDVQSGKTRSCGCLQKELVAERVRTHGQGAHTKRTAEYKTWLRIKSRCSRQTDADYPNYGGRGIAVCEQWASSFEAFFADMGKRPGLNYSIDRIDGRGPYAPDNCRWATPDVQANNTTWVKRVIVDGIEMSCSQAERLLGIGRTRISGVAYKKKIPHQEALAFCLARKKARQCA